MDEIFLGFTSNYLERNQRGAKNEKIIHEFVIVEEVTD